MFGMFSESAKKETHVRNIIILDAMIMCVIESLKPTDGEGDQGSDDSVDENTDGNFFVNSTTAPGRGNRESVTERVVEFLLQAYDCTVI